MNNQVEEYSRLREQVKRPRRKMELGGWGEKKPGWWLEPSKEEGVQRNRQVAGQGQITKGLVSHWEEFKFHSKCDR